MKENLQAVLLIMSKLLLSWFSYQDLQFLTSFSAFLWKSCYIQSKAEASKIVDR